MALHRTERRVRPQMSRQNRIPLADRVVKAAEAALAARHFVSAIDILVGIGWLDPETVERWRRGRIDCLEEVVRANLPRISEAMRLFRSWATARGLFASQTAYVGRTPRRQTLRFSRSGKSCDRGLIPDTLGVAGAFGEEARAPGGKGKSRSRTGGSPAIERRVDMPSVRRHRRSVDDGDSRPGVPALRWPR
jgi:hypothetical protein